MVTDLQLLSPLGKSDHSVITFKIKCQRDQSTPVLKTYYQKGNYEKMKEMFNNSGWKEKFETIPDDVEAQWKFFRDIYTKAEEECIPKKMVYINGNFSKKFSMPLDSKNLRKIKRKNRIWSKMRKKLASEEEQLEYRRLRNQVRCLTRKATKLLEKSVAKQAKSNPKAFWKFTQSKLKTRSGIPDLLIDKKNKIYTKTDQEKADTFSDQFSSVFTTEPDTNELPDFEERKYKEAIDTLEITNEMVKNKLKKIKVNKSPGPDNIHPRVLHEISDSITDIVTCIFSTSIRTHTLPNEWKHARVSALYKKESKSLPLNYRPVSLTSILCKVLESIIRDRVVTHMRENNLFSSKQFGFIGGRSTTLQLLHVLDIWSQILDQGGCFDVLYCDFMKAFDKVPHRRLVYKVSKYGIKGDILGWIESFLSHRTQCVVVGDSHSKTMPVTSGIPQGSVLGPLLFVLYINDLADIVAEGTFIFLFADDTKAFRHIKTIEDQKILQRDIHSLTKWSDIWLLKFHPDKCVVMQMGKSCMECKYEMKFDDECLILPKSKCEKDLGVQVDEKLNFEVHMNEKIKKANKVLAIVRRTFTHMDPVIFTQIFKGLVRPNLEYAQSVWSPHSKKMIKDVEDVQRRASKLVPGLKVLEYPERLKRLKLPTLAYRRVRGDMIEVYKLLATSNGYDRTIPCLLTLNNRSSHWSHSKQLYHLGSNRDILHFNFSRRVQDTWNNLPEEVVCAKNDKGEENIIAFEKALDKHWENQELKYNFEATITKSKYKKKGQIRN